MDEVISVFVPGYKDQVFHSLHQLQQRGVNCDVTLQACDGTANIHSIILAANSEKHIYSKISQTNEKLQIDCTKFSIHVIEAVVIFLYSGELVIEERFYDDLVKLCEDLNLSSAYDTLKQQCPVTERHLISNNKGDDSFKEVTNIKKEPCSPSDLSYGSFQSTNTIPEIGNANVPTTQTKTVCEKDNLYSKMANIKNDQGTSSDENDIETSSFDNDNISAIPMGNDNIQAAQLKTVSEGNNLFLKVHVTDIKNDQGTSSDENDDGMETSSFENDSTNNSGPSSSPPGGQFLNHIEKIVRQYVNNEETNQKEEVCTKKSNSVSKKNSTKGQNKKTSVKSGTKRSFGSVSSDIDEKTTIKKKKRTSTRKLRKEKDVINKNKLDVNDDSTDGNKDIESDITEDSLTPKPSWRKCVKCNLVYPTFAEWADHMRNLHKPYPCELCDYIGVEPCLYASHMYSQHRVVIDPKRYPLVQCNVQGCTYKSLSRNMKDHMRCHKYKKEKLVCHVCGMEFTSEGGLRSHSSFHKEEEMKFKCKECDKVFGWKHELRKHLAAEHKNFNLCHLCSFKSKNKTSLIVHLHNRHKEPIPDNMKTFKCDACDFYCFYPSYLKTHQQENHSDSLDFQCTICPKKFKTKKSLRGHYNNTHGSNFFKCDKCSYTTRSQTTLQVHQQSTHSEVRPYTCHLCEYSCKLKGNLNSHLKNMHKLEIVSINKLHEKVVKTGTGFDEYMEARRKLYEPGVNPAESIVTRPIEESCGVPPLEDNTEEDYQDLTE
ncbi:KRAB [Mytilus edulis]|uniref:KRAB n=1 Tax=Mytilus edulis TaxID=6550 RepID=A0A8S3QK61_MYTED|nr:KRAB [Mytilus edulis]